MTEIEEKPERPKSAKKLREEAERKSAELRAAEEKRRLDEEIKSNAIAKKTWDEIWHAFGKNRKKNRSLAFSNLLQGLSEHASELVPYYMTPKEFVSIIIETEQHTKGDQQSSSGDPRELVGAWLRGEEDMSRVPLEKIQ